MSELYEPECISLNYRELLAKSKELTFTISVSQQVAVDSATRKQSDSRVWFRFRTADKTASKMHSIMHTNSDMPSVSLMKSICYPALKFSFIGASPDSNIVRLLWRVMCRSEVSLLQMK